MILKKLTLSNFRLHKNTQLEFSENKNYLVGGNGQGKTSVLEAIYYLCTTKNISSCSDNEVVRFGDNYFDVSGSFKDLTQNNVRIFYTQTESKKQIFVDGKQVFRAAEIIGKYPVVILTPDDHSITQGTPGERRKFIDSVISQASETYLYYLLEYNKTLKQRASLLNQIRETNRNDLLEELEAWNIQLVKNGTQLIRRRNEFIKEFSSYVKEVFMVIMENQEEPQLTYEYLGGETKLEDIESSFTEVLNKKRTEEFRRGINLAGPHRDDIVFKLNSVELKKYGSQGQHKTFQIALRLAEFFYLKEKLGRVPIFLMDDVFGELDAFRASKISSYLKDIGQAFITLTDLSDFSHLQRTEQDAVIRIQSGEVMYVGV